MQISFTKYAQTFKSIHVYETMNNRMRTDAEQRERVNILSERMQGEAVGEKQK